MLLKLWGSRSLSPERHSLHCPARIANANSARRLIPLRRKLAVFFCFGFPDLFYHILAGGLSREVRALIADKPSIAPEPKKLAVKEKRKLERKVRKWSWQDVRVPA